MTEIEIEEAVVALIQTMPPEDCFRTPSRFFDPRVMWNALYYAVEKLEAEKAARAAEIKQHEAFRQDVNDELLAWFGEYEPKVPGEFARFIIAKPDPLVEAVADIGCEWEPEDANKLRAALAARGLKIVEDK